MVKLHVLLAHEVHFLCIRVKHAKHVAYAFSCSALTIKRNIASSNNQQSAIVVLHKQHLLAILLLAVQLALVAPVCHVLLCRLHNLRLGTIKHTLRLRVRIDIVSKRRKLLLGESGIEQLYIYLRIAQTLLLQSLILLLKHIVAVHGRLQRVLSFC